MNLFFVSWVRIAGYAKLIQVLDQLHAYITSGKHITYTKSFSFPKSPCQIFRSLFLVLAACIMVENVTIVGLLEDWLVEVEWNENGTDHACDKVRGKTNPIHWYVQTG